MQLLRALGSLSGPLYLLMGGLTYSLGAGIAKYLGYQLQARVYTSGLVIAVLLQASMGWLAEAFRPLEERLPQEQAVGDRVLVRRAALFAAFAALAAVAVLAFSILMFDANASLAAYCLGLSTLLILGYSTPPMQAARRGTGKLLIAAQIGYLAPTLGFLLEAGSMHRLLNWCTVSLTVLLVATLLALELPSYADDLRRERSTMLTRLGWQRGLQLHHGLVLTAYALLGLSVLSGFSFSVIGPAFLTLPFALLQIFILQGIATRREAHLEFVARQCRGRVCFDGVLPDLEFLAAIDGRVP